MNKILKRILVGTLTLSTLFTTTLVINPANQRYVLANNKEAELNAEVKAAIDRLNAKKNQINNLKASSQKMAQRIELLKAENDNVKKQYEEIQEQLKLALSVFEEKEKAYEDALTDWTNKKQEYNLRLATMFYYHKKSPWEIILESKGLKGFFTNIRLMNVIATADKNSLDDLKIAEEVAGKAQEEADKVYQDYVKFSEEKEKEIDQLEAGILNANSQLSALKNSLSHSQHDIAKLEQDLAQKQAAYASFKAKQKNYNMTFVGGGAVWPLPASRQVTSPYGQRYLSFDRYNNNYHTGTDISGPGVAGTPVVAAWAGYVANVSYPYPGALVAPLPNYVQLAHGNGIGTGYWHLQTITVAEGQFVAQGTIIGTCGSTGNSTGPHLHFEVYNPNSPNRGIRDTIDPMSVLGG